MARGQRVDRDDRGDILAALSAGYEQLAAARVVAGLGEGCVLVVMAAATAATRVPDRLFAIGFSLTMTVATLLLRALSVFTEDGQSEFFFYLFGFIAFIGLVVTPFLPAHAVRGQHRTHGSGKQPTQPHAIVGPAGALAANLLFWIGIGAIWPMMALIGAGQGVGVATVNDALATAMIIGIGAGFFAGWLGLRLGRIAPLLCGTAGLVAVMLSLPASGPELFGLLTGAFVIVWVITQPYFLGLAAEADPAGRTAGFAMTMQYAGLAVGPMLFGLAGQGGGTRVAVAAGVAASMVAAAAAVFTQMWSDARAPGPEAMAVQR